MSRSILDKIGENQREKNAEELHRESEKALEEAKKDDASRREYEAQLNRERLELMRMKQGLSDGGELTRKEDEPKKEYTLREKIENFFYHYKFYIIAGAAVVVVLTYLTVDYIRAERPDITVIYIAENYDLNYTADNIKDKWSVYTEDYNHDRRNIVKLYYIPAYYSNNSDAQQYLLQADRTKLIGEFQSGNTIIIMGNMKAYEELGVEHDTFVDARELFPGDPNAEEIGYKVSGTRFKELMGNEDFDDSDLYFSFRKPIKTFGMSEEKMSDNYDQALAWFRAFIEDRPVTE